MAFIHVARRELHCKIVYYGPGLGGKTTNLRQLFDHLPPARRGELTCLDTVGERTLFFDLLPIELGRVRGLTTRIHLYTVPGQPRYNASRRIVLQGVDGVVFVADSDPRRFFANRHSLDNLRENLACQGRSRAAVPLVFQYNKRDLPGAVSREQLDRLLNGDGAPVQESVAQRGEGVRETLRTILGLTFSELGAPVGRETRMSGTTDAARPQ
ncbi:MAG: gliding-motility protein MglA [Candidatus Eisenbacteria sp.]|nr:gliding-motility protein MglA [Candidatus Eisenbacteria bacterium]